MLKTLLTGLVLAGGLAPITALPALAARPPVEDDAPPNTRGRSAGSRGCSTAAFGVSNGNPSQAAMPALVLLTPEGMGKSLSTQPTFFWFGQQSSAGTPTIFRLYQYDQAAQSYQLLVEQQSSAAQTEEGIMALPLTDEMATLELGEQYLWQVEVVCDRDRPSGNLFAEAEFEVVEPTAEMIEALAAAATPAEKSAIFSAEQLWYDALAMTFSANSPQEMIVARRMFFEAVANSVNEQRVLESSPVIMRRDLVEISVP